jgi:hypothetical protein
MTDVILERKFDPALTPDGVLQMAVHAAGCFDIHRVAWHGSLLSADGHRMCCWFSAADLESTRIALRELGDEAMVCWRGSVHTVAGLSDEDIASANVLVERSFESAVTLQEIQDIEDAGIACLETRNVRFIRTFFAADRKRMICLYAAPDVESVCQAQRGAAVPFDEAWSFRMIAPVLPDDTSI